MISKEDFSDINSINFSDTWKNSSFYCIAILVQAAKIHTLPVDRQRFFVQWLLYSFVVEKATLLSFPRVLVVFWGGWTSWTWNKIVSCGSSHSVLELAEMKLLMVFIHPKDKLKPVFPLVAALPTEQYLMKCLVS